VVKTDDEKTILSERKGKGIWQGLYQFPLIESTKNIDKNELMTSEEFIDLFPNETTLALFNKKEIVHKLSHQHLHTQFWIVETKSSTKADIKWSEIEKYPVPVVIANFLASYHPKSN
jgi:A/G-specific adenine glycosylase